MQGKSSEGLVIGDYRRNEAAITHFLIEMAHWRTLNNSGIMKIAAQRSCWRETLPVRIFGLFCIILNFCLPLSAFSQSGSATSLTQWGVTWHFDKSYQYGQFVNGDYWVVGPVTITRIEPDLSDGHNGWEVNPAIDTIQGFDRLSPGYTSSLSPALPYRTQAGRIESIVKAVYGPITNSSDYSSYVKSAAVLTVLTEAPANPASLFRPPFVGNSKPLYRTSDLRLSRIPDSFAPVENSPTLASIATNFTPFRLDFHARELRPTNCMYDYTPQNNPVTNSAMLRLMMNDRSTGSQWNEALYKFTQYSIDTAHAVYLGFRKVTGHSPGYVQIAAWAATLLEGYGDMSAIKTYLTTAEGFSDYSYVTSTTRSGEALWGQVNSEARYWTYLQGLGGNQSNGDPYGYIDGGACGETYQLIVSPSLKAELLVLKLMPALQSAVNPGKFILLENYGKRWVNTGVWSQPDPCAPYTAEGTYGVDYGADPNKPGWCILDTDLAYYNSPTDFACKPGKLCGRFPEKHGTLKNTGQYKSAFVESMWNAYFSQQSGVAPGAPKALTVR